jgi:thiol-disulfide isomerase/thioredoxin
VLRILVVAAVVALVVGASIWWRRRDGHLHEASGSLRPQDLGVSRRSQDIATIVEFTGAGCGPCGPLRDRLDALADEIGDIRIVAIDAGERLDLAERYDVRRVPTVLIADERLRIRWRASGVPNDRELREALLGPAWAGRPHPDHVDDLH